MSKSFAVIGGGSWGTAIACLVARAVSRVSLYSIEDDVIKEVNNEHKNSKYLGESILPQGVVATSSLKDIILSDVIIIATPSYVFEKILQQLKEAGVSKSATILIATKGLCENPSQLFSDKIENELNNIYGFISGPNFAKEVADNKFTSITISSKNIDIAKEIASLLATDKLEITISEDIITIQIATIVKNIAAIKSGIIQSDGAGDNAKSWLVSCALQEIAKISKALGGEAETLNLPAVVGDLVLTCYSITSRNTKFGYEFHQNNFSKEFLANYPILVEGVTSARLLKTFLEKNQIEIDLPIIQSVWDVI